MTFLQNISKVKKENQKIDLTFERWQGRQSSEPITQNMGDKICIFYNLNCSEATAKISFLNLSNALTKWYQDSLRDDLECIFDSN